MQRRLNIVLPHLLELKVMFERCMDCICCEIQDHSCFQCVNLSSLVDYFDNFESFTLDAADIFSLACKYDNVPIVMLLMDEYGMKWNNENVYMCLMSGSIGVIDHLCTKHGLKIKNKHISRLVRIRKTNIMILVTLYKRGYITINKKILRDVIYFMETCPFNPIVDFITGFINKYFPSSMLKKMMVHFIRARNNNIIEYLLNYCTRVVICDDIMKLFEQDDRYWFNKYHSNLQLMIINNYELNRKMKLQMRHSTLPEYRLCLDQK